MSKAVVNNDLSVETKQVTISGIPSEKAIGEAGTVLSRDEQGAHFFKSIQDTPLREKMTTTRTRQYCKQVTFCLQSLLCMIQQCSSQRHHENRQTQPKPSGYYRGATNLYDSTILILIRLH